MYDRYYTSDLRGPDQSRAMGHADRRPEGEYDGHTQTCHCKLRISVHQSHYSLARC